MRSGVNFRVGPVANVNIPPDPNAPAIPAIPAPVVNPQVPVQVPPVANIVQPPIANLPQNQNIVPLPVPNAQVVSPDAENIREFLRMSM